MEMKPRLKRIWKENRGLFFFLVFMFVFRSACADWNSVPTGSMKPTIVEGDRIFVNKMAYDIRVPFTHISLKHLADPERGDIIVFDSANSDKRLVKRVIGLPGETVALRNNVLYINGTALEYDAGASSHAQTEYAPPEPYELDETEWLGGVTHSVRKNIRGTHLSNFQSVQVPAGHYLAMGDNRDNSADSRVIGFVPRGEIVGRTRNVVLSFNYDNYYLPRKNRFFRPL